MTKCTLPQQEGIEAIKGTQRIVRRMTCVGRVKGKPVGVKTFLCRDVGTDDFERAAQNREIVEKHMYIQAYLEIEAWLARTEITARLPNWITVGTVPQAGGMKQGSNFEED